MISTGNQQRYWCPCSSGSVSGGSSVRQRSCTYAQRGLNLQPAGGSIVQIASVHTLAAVAGAAPYDAAKHGMVGFSKAAAVELAEHGVRVNLVSPGPIEFPGGAWEKIRQNMPDLYERMRSLEPMGRMGTPEEVADAVAFLASERASWITGVNLIVDGGFTKRVAF